MYEIEFRGKISEEKYKSTIDFLNINGKNLGEDDKEVYYYIFKDKLLKLVNNISKGNAKVSLKLNRIGDGAVFEEMEFFFDQNDFEKAASLFNKLDLNAKVMTGPQKRVNYEYKGCEIAMKFSDVWEYHFEIEKVVDSTENQEKVESEIRSVAQELGLEIMSEEDLKNFVENVESKIK